MNQLVLKKKNELMKKKKGFTLVELIIVIAIIAVLAAVAIPKFGAVKKNSNVAADQANAKIIATAVATAVANGDENPATDS
ncbi:prepilin-type N-terminal cleavage/methylation domain-containing protein, partial [Clostridium butyricum]